MNHRLGQILAIVLAALGVTSVAQAQPVLAPATVVGPNVTLNWTAHPGDIGALVQVGGAPGAYVLSLPVPGTAAATPAPVGVYYVRVVGQPSGLASNEIVVHVASAVAPPGTPSQPQAFRNGSNLLLSWAPGAGGTPTGYLLRAGTGTGASNLGVIPTAGPGFALGGVPAGTFFVGVRAVNGAGPSAESPELAFSMPGCDVPPAPTLTTGAWGSLLTASWTPVPGASSYIFSYSGPGHSGQLPFGPGATRLPVAVAVPQGTWTFGIQAVYSCGQTSAIGMSTLVIDGASLRLQPRAADPAYGVPGYAAGIVADFGARFRGDLLNSCVEHGGNNRWLFRVIEELRKHDKRWGLNWKRTRFGDMSQDVITYNWGPDPDEGTHKVRVWDIIGGHCGPNPVAGFSEITAAPPPQERIGAVWTLIPYIQAGFVP